jgi:hypothetical protein
MAAQSLVGFQISKIGGKLEEMKQQKCIFTVSKNTSNGHTKRKKTFYNTFICDKHKREMFSLENHTDDRDNSSLRLENLPPLLYA